ncbi:hypothetical protein JVT61DRAFT_2133 [Boletus reticuloceps]|uniref:Uncharacterized protein n=1 Tax=Boletus reticuloceps TaxID=495285 RepID=A0A8I2YNV9_9AGAM|nr:hypothetical protein JVT61DRAFT_2133 [Boletus reticuloceps]
MAKERRCNLFDDEGRPRRLRADGTKGCFRDASACHFAHPHEREWKTAQSSLPPRPDVVADSDSEFYYMLVHSDRQKDGRGRNKGKERDKERARERGKDSQRKHSSSVLESPRTATPPGLPSRRSTFDSAVDGNGATKRGRSPALSSSSDQLERLRKDNQYRPKDLPPSRRDYLPRTSRRSRSHSKSKGKDKEQVDLPRKTPPARSHVPDASTTQHPSTLPPEPSMPPPRQPAPPPPQVPEIPKLPPFVSNQKTASSGGVKELSVDEQRLAWHERIDLMFSSITSRRDYTKLESELSQIRMLSDSSLVNNMSEADRARINAQRMALELQMDVKRKEVNDTTQKLIGSNFWPILRTPQVTEMEKTLEEAKKHVVEVRGLLDDVKNSCAALFKTSASDWTQDADRPVKRRRLEGEVNTPGPPSSGDAEMAEDAAMELEEFRDRLTSLDRHLVDLENDITQRNTVISDEIELRIDARLEEEDALYPPIKEPGEVSESEIEAVVDAKNKELVRAVTVTGEEIGALAVEVAELITKVNALEARCKTAGSGKPRIQKQSCPGLDTIQHANSQDALVRRDKEIEAVAAALQAYISQAPAGQTAGDLPSAEYIIQSLGSQLDGLFREKFCATMVNIQQEVFDKVQDVHNDTLDTVSPKIMLLLKMVNLITARLGKSDILPDIVNNG